MQVIEWRLSTVNSCDAVWVSNRVGSSTFTSSSAKRRRFQAMTANALYTPILHACTSHLHPLFYSQTLLFLLTLLKTWPTYSLRHIHTRYIIPTRPDTTLVFDLSSAFGRLLAFASPRRSHSRTPRPIDHHGLIS